MKRRMRQDFKKVGQCKRVGAKAREAGGRIQASMSEPYDEEGELEEEEEEEEYDPSQDAELIEAQRQLEPHASGCPSLQQAKVAVYDSRVGEHRQSAHVQ